MKSIRKRHPIRFALAALPALLAWGPLRAQGVDAELQKTKAEIAKIKKDVQKTEGEFRRADSLAQAEAAQASQSLERQGKDKARREKEIAALEARARGIRSKINAERAAMARQQAAIDEIGADGRHLASILAGYCDSLLARIAAGLPWDRETRADRVKALKKDLETGTAGPDEGLARLTAVLKEEIKAGDEIVILNKPVTRKNGEVINAQILKIGNQWLVYADEEGERFGALERKPGAVPPAWEWREDMGFAEKNRIREALEVKAAKRPPQLIALDLGIALDSASAAKGGRP